MWLKWTILSSAYSQCYARKQKHSKGQFICSKIHAKLIYCNFGDIPWWKDFVCMITSWQYNFVLFLNAPEFEKTFFLSSSSSKLLYASGITNREGGEQIRQLIWTCTKAICMENTPQVIRRSPLINDHWWRIQNPTSKLLYLELQLYCSSSSNSQHHAVLK